MSPEQQEWTDLRAAWSRYSEAVGQWLDAAPQAETDPSHVDELIHGVIHTHNDWSEQLAQMVEATHHH